MGLPMRRLRMHRGVCHVSQVYRPLVTAVRMQRCYERQKSVSHQFEGILRFAQRMRLLWHETLKEV